jgi:CRISPR-associated protein Cas1
MSTLFVDRRGADIDAEGDTVVVRAEGERKGTVPLKPLERVVVRGGARLTSRLLSKLAESGIGLLILGGRKRQPTAALIGQPSSDATLRLAQGDLLKNENARAAISQAFVAWKVKGHLDLLQEAETQRKPGIDLRHGITGLRRSLNEITTGNPARESLRGMEGAAAATYFKAFVTLFPPSLGFAGRNRRPPRDPVNACLSLGYTLLHFDAVREAASVGLDPAIGIYHELAPGRESLACDLAEPFRPAVDRFVLRLFAGRELRVENFKTTADGCLMGKAARRDFYAGYEEAATHHRQALSRLARRLTKVIRDGGKNVAIAALDPASMIGESDEPPEDVDYRI